MTVVRNTVVGPDRDGQPRPTTPTGAMGRALVIVVGTLVVLALLGSVLGATLMGPGMMGPGMMGGYSTPGVSSVGGWTWGLMLVAGWLMMLLFWGALVVGIVLLVRWVTGPTTETQDTPLAVLQRRYAVGEITREEFEQMRQVLGG